MFVALLLLQISDHSSSFKFSPVKQQSNFIRLYEAGLLSLFYLLSIYRTIYYFLILRPCCATLGGGIVLVVAIYLGDNKHNGWIWFFQVACIQGQTPIADSSDALATSKLFQCFNCSSIAEIHWHKIGRALCI